MALSVSGLTAAPDLGVRLLAGSGADERPITWVHVSELDDPTPFLSGGELLLTTGLFVRPATDFPAYVERLAAAGVLGLGFGVGLSCEEVPAELVSAAERLGLAVLEVPRRTPFIALSRAVSRALAADEYAAVTRTFTAQQELTRAALSPESPARLIRLLARKVDGWVVLLDARGAPLALGGARAGAMAPVVAVEVARLREHRGAVGSGFDVDGDSVSLQPVGAGRRRAFLAVGRPGPLPAADRHLVNAAVMLLTLGLEQDGAPAMLDAVRAAALELALNGHLDLARSISARVGAAWPADPLVVLVAPAPPARADRRTPTRADHPTPSRADQLRRRGSTPSEWDGWDGSQRTRPRVRHAAEERDRGVEAALPVGPLADGSVWSAELDGELIVVAHLAVDRRLAEMFAADLAATGRIVGWAEATRAADLPTAREQARQAAGAAAGRGVPFLAFDAIGTAGIAGVWDPVRAAAFAASLLAPLVEHDRTGRGDLVASLRAWLAHHGQWDPAAAALGVHRHTLRRRMATAADLVGRDLDSPTVRSELWLALETIGGPERVTGP